MPPPTHVNPRLQRKIRALSSEYARLARMMELKELLRIIRQPGWTTPAELLLTLGMLDSLTESAATLRRSTQALTRGARAVGRGK